MVKPIAKYQTLWYSHMAIVFTMTCMKFGLTDVKTVVMVAFWILLLILHILFCVENIEVCAKMKPGLAHRNSGTRNISYTLPADMWWNKTNVRKISCLVATKSVNTINSFFPILKLSQMLEFQIILLEKLSIQSMVSASASTLRVTNNKTQNIKHQ